MSTESRDSDHLQPPAPPMPRSSDFWQEKSLDELIAEQGIRPVQHFEEVFGKGADLWANDEEFEAFLAILRAARVAKEE